MTFQDVLQQRPVRRVFLEHAGIEEEEEDPLLCAVDELARELQIFGGVDVQKGQELRIDSTDLILGHQPR